MSSTFRTLLTKVTGLPITALAVFFNLLSGKVVMAAQPPRARVAIANLKILKNIKNIPTLILEMPGLCEGIPYA
jgi:hypothetical protein